MKLLPETQLIVPHEGCFSGPPQPVVSRPRTDRDAFAMTSAEASKNEWCIIEWADFNRTIVHASEVCEFNDNQTCGNTVFIKRGDEQIRSSLVARSANRRKLVRELNKYEDERIDVKPVADDDDDGGDDKEPSDFEPSATDWAPSDENLSDSEFEVENKRRKMNTSEAVCRKRQYKYKKVLTPSNKVNTNAVVRRKNNRKQSAPKHYISPPKEEQMFYVPLPKKQISPINGKVVHILPNSTRPPNSIKKGPNINNNIQVTPYGKKRITTNTINTSQRKRTSETIKKITRKQNASYTNSPKQNTDKTNCTPKNSISKTFLTPKQKSVNSSTPKSNGTITRKIKPEKDEIMNESKNPIEENNPTEQSANNILNTQDKEPESETLNTEQRAENRSVVNNPGDNGRNISNQVNGREENTKKRPETVNVMMDVKMYLEFRHSVRKIYKMYDTALKVIPRIKRKELGLKKLHKFYKPELVRATDESLKNTSNKNTVKEIVDNDTNDMDAENYSDENVENEDVDDFDRSDDNILISNKFANIHTQQITAKDKTQTEQKLDDSKMVAIGSGKTLIPKDKFRKIKWNSYTVATRGLLLAAFPRRVLATHSMTGKKSPAFLNKPAKMCLDPKKVSDIIIEVMYRFKVRENLVRSVITTKCADESKMFKMRMQKKERESAAAEKKNNKRKPTLAA